MRPIVILVILLSVLLHLSCGIVINSPASIAGSYASIRGSFSSVLQPLSTSTVSSDLVLTNPCVTITTNITGKIVFSSVDAGTCLYYTQGANVLAAGGVGLIVSKTTATIVVLPMLYTASHTMMAIPTVSISGVDAAVISAQLKLNVSVSATIGYTAASAADKQVLLDLWTATNGASWRFGATGQYDAWQSSTDPCSAWYGVVCNATSGAILGIALPLNSLSGTIPSSIGTLTSLTQVQLSANTALTSIPSSMYELPMMISIEASGDGLTSSLSSNMGVMTRLKTLNLASNKLTGTIPESFSQLTSLITAQLNGNAFTGPIPTNIGNLNKVTQISFSTNSMSGSVPSSIGGMSSLTRLEIAHNSFGGDLPSSLTKLTNLTFLDISDNTFSGSMPTELTALTKLTYLNVAKNALSGSVPDLSKATAMLVMDLSNNQFSGALDGSKFSSVLTALRASHNLFTSITSFSTKTTLLTADVSYNNLQSISDLQALPKITTDQFNSGISGLTSIDLSHNQIKNQTLLFDMSLENYPSLTSINLAYNSIGGTLSPPTSVSTSQYLRTIDLSNNFITGSIPDVYGQFASLISNNSIYHGSSSLIPSFANASYDTLTDYTDGNAYCPSFTSGVLSLYIDHSYHDYLLCQCKSSYRRKLGAVPLVCLECPDHVLCNGTRTNDTTFYYEAGYYPTPTIAEPEAMIECSNCMAASSQVFACKEGYTDRVCSKCEDGYFLRGKRCEKCQPAGLIFFCVILVIIVLIIVYFAIIFSRRSGDSTASLDFENKENLGTIGMTKPTPKPAPHMIAVLSQRRDSTSSTSSTNAFLPHEETPPKRTVTVFKHITFEPSKAIITITINYTQTLSILCRYFTLDYSLKQLIGITEVANVSGTGFGFECVDQIFAGTRARYLLTSIQPLAVVLIAAVLAAGGIVFIRLLLRQGYRWWLIVCGRVLFFLLDFLFFPVLVACISIFKCVDDPATHVSYLDQYPFSGCNAVSSGEKVSFLVVNLLGIYALFIFLLALYNRTASRTTKGYVRTMFGFFFRQYKPEYFYSGIIYLSRRLIFSIINGLLDTTSLHLFISNMVFICFSIVLVYFVRPFKRPVDNHFEIASFLLFVGSFTGTGIAKAFFWVAVNCALYLCFLVIFVVSLFPKWSQIKSFILCEWAKSPVVRYDGNTTTTDSR